jgi:sugar-specific transcriptional regulator TrmB
LSGLSEEAVGRVLRDFGLTDRETEVCLFLAKHGVLKGEEISKQTKTHKTLIYRILKSLQAKALVESTLEFPARLPTSATTLTQVFTSARISKKKLT